VQIEALQAEREALLLVLQKRQPSAPYPIDQFVE